MTFVAMQFLVAIVPITGFLAMPQNNKNRKLSSPNAMTMLMKRQDAYSDDAASSRKSMQRRQFLSTVVASAMVTCTTTAPASAVYVLDEETGEYVEKEEEDWQSAWRSRLDKASTMSKDEIFQAARGAGNLDLKDGPESDASKKRRAMSACRDASVRSKADAGSEKECTKRVFAGEVDFLLNAM